MLPRSLRALTIGVLALALAAGTVATASASVAEKSNKKFCAVALKITTIVPDGTGDDALIDAARDLAGQYRKLAKAAPNGKLRKAAKTISKYYDRLVDSGDPNSSPGNYTDEETAAVSTLITYSYTNCASLGATPTS